MKQGKGHFIKGAFIIAVGGFTAKLIGALYRIPLTNLIGGKGIGLYQLVYPIYCLLLTVSATGIPSPVAKLTAEQIKDGYSGKAVLKSAIRLFSIIGIFGTIIMCATAPFLSKIQGSQGVLFGYFALAPSVFLVSIISVFRGYFQGKNNFTPTALSEICEQLIKVGAGLYFAYRFQASVEKAVGYLLLAVTLSELITTLLMWGIYRAKRDKNPQKDGGRVATKRILALALPVTASSLLLPLSSLLDSVLAVRLMGVYAVEPVTLYGLFSGGAVTVINLPVSVCYGIAAASVPAVASAKGKGSVKKRWKFSLLVTVVVALPSALALYFFAQPVVKIIYKNLENAQLSTLVSLVKTLSVSALFLSCTQTLSACLTAQGKPQKGAIAMLIAVTVKTACYTLLLKNPKISVFGLAHATNLCYFVAFLLDLLYNIRVNKRRKE